MNLWTDDFDNTTAFLALKAALGPLGFFDTTWRNDACPSLSWSPDGENCDDLDSGIRVWIDYYNPELREVCADITDDIWIDFGGFGTPFKSWCDLRDIVAHCKQAIEIAQMD